MHHMHLVALRDQGESDSLEPDLQVFVSSWMWVLGTELRSPAKAMIEPSLYPTCTPMRPLVGSVSYVFITVPVQCSVQASTASSLETDWLPGG